MKNIKIIMFLIFAVTIFTYGCQRRLKEWDQVNRFDSVEQRVRELEKENKELKNKVK